MHSRSQFGNCLFGLVYLWWTGRVTAIVAISSQSAIVPWHFIGLTKRGHAIHFAHETTSQASAPLWFRGRYVGVSRSRLLGELHKSGRRLKWVYFL